LNIGIPISRDFIVVPLKKENSKETRYQSDWSYKGEQDDADPTAKRGHAPGQAEGGQKADSDGDKRSYAGAGKFQAAALVPA